MQFTDLDFVIKRCEEHLDNTGSRNSEIENYFVQYLLVRICAEYEARVSILVQRRCSRSKDKHLRAFAQKTATYICKRFDIGDISDILARFGSDYKDAFRGQVVNQTPHVAWDNIYTNRHAVAHKLGTPMSLGDLKRDYAESLKVLDALVAALNLRPKEVRGLN
jgi:hypothetical protein